MTLPALAYAFTEDARETSVLAFATEMGSIQAAGYSQEA